METVQLKIVENGVRKPTSAGEGSKQADSLVGRDPGPVPKGLTALESHGLGRQMGADS